MSLKCVTSTHPDWLMDYVTQFRRPDWLMEYVTQFTRLDWLMEYVTQFTHPDWQYVTQFGDTLTVLIRSGHMRRRVLKNVKQH